MNYACPYCGNVSDDVSTYVTDDSYMSPDLSYSTETHYCVNNECNKYFMVKLEFALVSATVLKDE